MEPEVVARIARYVPTYEERKRKAWDYSGISWEKEQKEYCHEQ